MPCRVPCHAMPCALPCLGLPCLALPVQLAREPSGGAPATRCRRRRLRRLRRLRLLLRRLHHRQASEASEAKLQLLYRHWYDTGIVAGCAALRPPRGCRTYRPVRRVIHRPSPSLLDALCFVCLFFRPSGQSVLQGLSGGSGGAGDSP